VELEVLKYLPSFTTLDCWETIKLFQNNFNMCIKFFPLIKLSSQVVDKARVCIPHSSSRGSEALSSLVRSLAHCQLGDGAINGVTGNNPYLMNINLDNQ